MENTVPFIKIQLIYDFDLLQNADPINDWKLIYSNNSIRASFNFKGALV